MPVSLLELNRRILPKLTILLQDTGPGCGSLKSLYSRVMLLLKNPCQKVVYSLPVYKMKLVSCDFPAYQEVKTNKNKLNLYFGNQHSIRQLCGFGEGGEADSLFLNSLCWQLCNFPLIAMSMLVQFGLQHLLQ